jgi:hypothetical protein
MIEQSSPCAQAEHRRCHDTLKEALNKYREAVATFSPGLPPRLPWEARLWKGRNPNGGYANSSELRRDAGAKLGLAQQQRLAF